VASARAGRSAALPATATRRVATRQIPPACNRDAKRSIFSQIPPSRRYSSNTKAELNIPRPTQPPTDPRNARITVDKLRYGDADEFTRHSTPRELAGHNKKAQSGAISLRYCTIPPRRQHRAATPGEWPYISSSGNAL
jgi:hypothetical protein